ncbi:MAG: hypothetical protein AAGF75_04375, partial [Cyanobacteria bacterium P01_H01_bin.130]
MLSSPNFPQWAIAQDPVAVSSQCFLSDIVGLLQQRQKGQRPPATLNTLAPNFESPEALSIAAVQDLNAKACANCVIATDYDHQVLGL